MTMMTMVVVPTLVESGGGGLSGCDGDGGDAALALLLPRLWLASTQRPLIFFQMSRWPDDTSTESLRHLG